MALEVGEGQQRLERVVTLQPSSWVTSLAFRGNVLAAASNDGIATLWRMPMGELLASLRHEEPICSLGLSAEFVVCGCRDGVVAVWTSPEGRLVQKLRHQKSVGAVAVDDTDEGCLLATGSDDLTAVLWRLPSCERLAELRFQDSVGTLALGHGYLATGCDDGELSIWLAPAPAPVKHLLSLAQAGSGCWACSVALRGDVVACALSDRSVAAFVLPSGERLFRLAFDDMVLSVALDGRLLACGSRDGSTTLWRLPTGNRLLGFDHEPVENAVAGGSDVGPVPIYAVALEDGLLACAPNDFTVTAWKVGDDDILRCLGKMSLDTME
mmetsp:Transcript_153296/g.491555  ORF Transcript_153296/g.491555 Transcript_153296/m.491555 type:complete len:325 (+) Transcript_153296:111-1085(+)